MRTHSNKHGTTKKTLNIQNVIQNTHTMLQTQWCVIIKSYNLHFISIYLISRMTNLSLFQGLDKEKCTPNVLSVCVNLWNDKGWVKTLIFSSSYWYFIVQRTTFASCYAMFSDHEVEINYLYNLSWHVYWKYRKYSQPFESCYGCYKL